MTTCERFVDVHCHILPGIDDGSRSWDESLAMARMASSDGIATTIATVHQLGAFAHNTAQQIRHRTEQMQELLDQHNIALAVLPGADVRIEPELPQLLARDEVLTLGDRGRHVLLELPHELYFPLEPVLAELKKGGWVGILSHPERNQGLLRQRELLPALVDTGCLMQITAGSLTGTFGSASQEFCRWMLEQGLVHLVATDAHGQKSRRPLLQRAFEQVAQVTDEETALDLCCRNPAAIANGQDVEPIRRARPRRRSWWPWSKAG